MLCLAVEKRMSGFCLSTLLCCPGLVLPSVSLQPVAGRSLQRRGVALQPPGQRMPAYASVGQRWPAYASVGPMAHDSRPIFTNLVPIRKAVNNAALQMPD